MSSGQDRPSQERPMVDRPSFFQGEERFRWKEIRKRINPTQTDSTQGQQADAETGDPNKTLRYEKRDDVDDYDDYCVRLRYEKRDDGYWENWLLSWRHTDDPTQVQCYTAYQTFSFCISFPQQMRHIYRHGSPNSCAKELGDIKTCFKLRGMASRDPERARAFMAEQYKPKPDPTETVWARRQSPPKGFDELPSRMQKMDKDSSTGL
eukprot:g5589.t1